MKNNNGFFLVSLWSAVAIGVVCCVGITAKAHKITIREMRDRAYAGTIRNAKEIGCNLKNGVKTNLAYIVRILQKGSPKKHISHLGKKVLNE